MEMSIRESGAPVKKETEKEKILSKYSPNVQHICGHCRQILIFAWREVRRSFEVASTPAKRGCVSTSDFYDILKAYGVILGDDYTSILTKAFQLGRNNAVIRFDDFLKVCFLTR